MYSIYSKGLMKMINNYNGQQEAHKTSPGDQCFSYEQKCLQNFRFLFLYQYGRFKTFPLNDNV